MDIIWKQFGKEPLDGIYWVSGLYPNEQERTKYTEFVALVNIKFIPKPNLEYEASPIAPEIFGDFDPELYGILFVSKFTKPTPKPSRSYPINHFNY